MILFYLIMFFQRTVTTFWKWHASCLTMEFGICFAWGIIYEGVCFPCIGDCILQYWNHGAALKPCKCPMCSQPITRLIPEASFDHCQNVEVLQNVQKYNRIFVGGTYGLILVCIGYPPPCPFSYVDNVASISASAFGLGWFMPDCLLLTESAWVAISHQENNSWDDGSWCSQ